MSYKEMLPKGFVEPRKFTPSPPPSTAEEDYKYRIRTSVQASKRQPTPPLPANYDSMAHMADIHKLMDKLKEIRKKMEELDDQYERDMNEVSEWNYAHPRDERPFPSERRHRLKMHNLELEYLRLEQLMEAHDRLHTRQIMARSKIARPRSRSRSRSPPSRKP